MCETCIEGKHQNTSFLKDETTRAFKLLELVHSNVCEPMKTTSHVGAWYFVTFINNFSRKIHVYFLKAKGKVFDKFKAYKALVENQTNMKIKTLQSSRGKFVSKKFDDFLCKFNDKQVHLIHHNKMELQNELTRPSRSALKTWFVHKDFIWNFRQR